MKRRSPVNNLRWFDERLKFASIGRKTISKIFPDHWSYMLGEVALYSFMILVATGVYLALFFTPSAAEVVYKGSYPALHGQVVSEAYATTVQLSWDVRAGLLFRQVHHWAAHIFIGAIVLHMCRIFFTAMFRRPREMNWMVGLTMLILAIVNAFFGYSMPDDLLSGTGLRIFWSVGLSIPVIGPWLDFLFFNGHFPGHSLLLRLFTFHVFVLPALIATLIAVHLGTLIRQKHSHFSGPGRRDVNVVGSRMWPTYALRSLGLLFAVAAVSFLLGGLAQINPIWVWGDYDPANILSPSVADWYIAWIEGGLRLFPPVEFTIDGYLVPNQFFAGVLLPAVSFGILYAWPFLDRVITGDRGTHHISARPRECPIRTAIGIGALTFFAVLLAASGEELLSQWTAWPVGDIRAVLRGVVLVGPLITGTLAYVLARALRDSGKEGTIYLSGRDFAQLRAARRAQAHPPTVPGQAEQPTHPREPGGPVAAGTVSQRATSGPPLAVRPETRELAEAPRWLGRRARTGIGEANAGASGEAGVEEASVGAVPVRSERELSEAPPWLQHGRTVVPAPQAPAPPAETDSVSQTPPEKKPDKDRG